MTEFKKDSSIRSLRDNVLKHPGMYIGRKLDTDGLHFLLFLIIENVVNPTCANECTTVKISIKSTDEIVITDNGRGLPVSEFDKRPKIEQVLTWIINRHPDQKYYQEFGFLDYTGAVLNCVSARLDIETTVENYRYSLKCTQGEIVEPLQRIGTSVEQGTRITFLPDNTAFNDTRFDGHRILSKLRQLAKEYPQIQFEFNDEHSNLRESLIDTNI